jgi:hypothetical protein
VNVLETRTLKFTGRSTKPRATTRLVLRESQITYGLLASFLKFKYRKTHVQDMVIRRSRGLHDVDVKAVNTVRRI